MRFPLRRTLTSGLLAGAAFAPLCRAQDEAVRSAVASFQSGDLAAAEQILRKDLRAHPADAMALDVLGAVLDQEKKFGDADEVYRRALALSPRSPSLLNNYGNHLLAQGKSKEAQAAFTKVLVLQPGHPNAAVQIAGMALAQNEPARADRALRPLPADVANRPDVLLLRMRAAYALHRAADGDALLKRAATGSEKNAEQSFALGVALSAAGQHEKAEAFFSRTLEMQPDNFDALYDLGLAAAHAGHADRAAATLGQALEKQPANVDLLCDLAAVDLKRNQGEASLELLVRARKLAPDRADIQLLLARATSQLGYFADAAQAWDDYLKLHPEDETARRERAFARTAMGAGGDGALADLQAYAGAHPDDAVGQYEYGAAQAATDTEKAERALTRAIALKPDFAAAHLARGLLLYRRNRPELAMADFEKAARAEPGNPVILVRLGQTYTALNRPADALRVLREAARIAPENSSVLLQLGRALSAAGQQAEAAAAFAHYRELSSTRQSATRPAGLVDFLNLSPDEQRARYRAGVERTVAASPANAEAQARYLALLLADGKTDEALAVSRKISALAPAPAVIEDAAARLLEARQSAAARAMIQAAAERGSISPALQLDLALAADSLDGASAALQESDKIPDAARTADVRLARAQFLAQLNRAAEAGKELDAALQSWSKQNEPNRADLVRSAAHAFLEQGLVPDALKLLGKAVEVFPDDPALRVMNAYARAVDGRNTDEEFRQIESRWPEWPTVWTAHGFVLVAAGQGDKAKTAFQTAQSLGSSVRSSGAAQSQDPRAQLLHEFP